MKQLTALADKYCRHQNRYVGWLAEFIVFGLKQAWASIFGGLLLLAILLSSWFYPADLALARYDFLLLFAIFVQIVLVVTGLEKPSEVKVILLFHVVGTVMELFKTHAGSWSYPEANVIRIFGVPLFSGFMYSAVGSYLARVWRSFEFRFETHPPVWSVFVLAIGIYVNFFTHHFIMDFRAGLFVITALMFFHTKIYFRVWHKYRTMPLLLGFFLVSLFIWIAENASTFGQIWLYPDQENGWQLISPAKLGSWFLLLLLSYALIASLHTIKQPDQD